MRQQPLPNTIGVTLSVLLRPEMTKSIILSGLSLYAANHAVAQPLPMITWEEALGGTLYESALECSQTADGGYILAGSSQSNDGHVTGNHGMADGWVVKLNSFGMIEWQRAYGGSGSDSFAKIRQTNDAGYICAGFTASNNGDVSGNHGLMDVWVVKLDAIGGIEWQRCLGGSDYELSYDVVQTANGGYLVSTQTSSSNGDVTINHGLHDAWIIKLDASGNIVWQTSLGGSGYDYLLEIQTTLDGRSILAGGSTSNDGDVSGNHGGYDFWVVELDPSGAIIWQRMLGGSFNELAGGLDLANDGGILLSGYTLSNDGDVSGNHGESDVWVVRLAAEGGLTWQQTFGGTLAENGAALVQTGDDSMVVIGFSDSDDGDVTGNHGGRDVWLFKLNGAGDLIWQKPLGGSAMEMGADVDQTADGGYIACGLSRSIDGDVSLNQGAEDAWVVKLDPDDVGIEELPVLEIIVSPNPLTDELHVTSLTLLHDAYVVLIDASGRSVLTLPVAGTSFMCEVGGLARGAYTLTIHLPYGTWSSHIILE